MSQQIAERVKDTGRNKGIGSDRALARYAQEGVLRRMKAAFGDRVVLKGALLFLVENGNEHRPTMDADLHFHDGLDDAVARIRYALAADLVDGLRYEVTKVIQAEHNEEPGYGLPLAAWVGKTKIDTKVDVGFGGRRPRGVVEKTFPSLLKGAEPLTIACLPWPNVAAEKIHAIQSHGVRNTRMKDFHDIAIIKEGLDPDAVARAMVRTWEDRHTELPTDLLPGLTIDYADSMQKVWEGFVKRSKLEGKAPAQFAEVTYRIRPWVEDVLERARVLSREAAPRVPSIA
ncbi:nucleotidyl transferase AbiEii/AbiGii toxin family protein [Microvirga tunisiensis]|nr:nucleotidyl transferase AbiEii/AbiGii toxin family protein [Microvirga tunisiensis]